MADEQRPIRPRPGHPRRPTKAPETPVEFADLRLSMAARLLRVPLTDVTMVDGDAGRERHLQAKARGPLRGEVIITTKVAVAVPETQRMLEVRVSMVVHLSGGGVGGH